MEPESQPASPPVTEARTVLAAIHELERLGHDRVMKHLETVEPDLTDHAFESLSRIYHDLLELGVPARPTRTLYRRIEALTLVLIGTHVRDKQAFNLNNLPPGSSK